MPLSDLAKKHFTHEEKQQLDAALETILNIVSAKTYNLSPKERMKYGKVGEHKKLLLDAVKDFNDRNPALSAPDVNWAEFNADYATHKYAEGKSLQMLSVAQMLINIKMLHSHDNMTDALLDYSYANYRSRFASENGFNAKAEKLKLFFPKTGKRKKKG